MIIRKKNVSVWVVLTIAFTHSWSAVRFDLDYFFLYFSDRVKNYFNIVFQCYKYIIISIDQQQSLEENSTNPEVFMLSSEDLGLGSQPDVKIVTWELDGNESPQWQGKQTHLFYIISTLIIGSKRSLVGIRRWSTLYWVNTSNFDSV